MKQNKIMRKAIVAGKELAKKMEKKTCVACNGSGRYDSYLSPVCQACNGTGVSKNG
jgi:DnaJ-class molecular chaperone